MCEPRDITEGDAIAIHREPFTDIEFEVSDTDEGDIGLTSIFVASLVAVRRGEIEAVGRDVYSLTHAEGSREVVVEHVDSSSGYVDNEEWRFSVDAVEIL